jgi:hypothetical protein
MDLATYQIEARQTAVFEPAIATLYPPMGLINEFGEFVDAYYSSGEDSEHLIAELGDVLWYFSTTCDLIDAQIEDIINAAPINIVSAHIDILVTIGKIAGIVKKAERDKVFKKAALREQLINFASYIRGYAFVMDVQIEDVARANIKKLQDRQARNVLYGDGDNR